MYSMFGSPRIDALIGFSAGVITGMVFSFLTPDENSIPASHSGIENTFQHSEYIIEHSVRAISSEIEILWVAGL